MQHRPVSMVPPVRVQRRASASPLSPAGRSVAGASVAVDVVAKGRRPPWWRPSEGTSVAGASSEGGVHRGDVGAARVADHIGGDVRPGVDAAPVGRDVGADVGGDVDERSRVGGGQRLVEAPSAEQTQRAQREETLNRRTDVHETAE
jgi:hypothetical protein